MAVLITEEGTKKTRKTTTSEKDVYRCVYCDRKQHKTAFYRHEVHYNTAGITPICKKCANEIANRVEYGVSQGMTMESLLFALRLMDKPFIRTVFEDADRAAKDPNMDAHHTRSAFGNYMAILVKTKFANGTWDDTEARTVRDLEETTESFNAMKSLPKEQIDEMTAEMEINRADCLRLIGYDPFVNEAEEDKPLLYAQMIKYLDSSPESNEDAMKVSSIVQIVKAYHQAGKIDDVISKITSDPGKLLDNAATLKNLHATQKTLMDTALSLAKDNGISFAHNTNNSKGANTLSGKLKKMKELDLREIEVNGFDIGTAAGIKMVSDISTASILDQIRINENDIPEMIADQRILIEKWERVAYKASEQARILLRENQDLKEYLRSIGKEDVVNNRSFLLDDEGGVNDPDIYDDEFQQSMRENEQGDIWALEEDENAEEILGQDRVDVEFAEKDVDDEEDDFEVDPEDIDDQYEEDQDIGTEYGNEAKDPGLNS